MPIAGYVTEELNLIRSAKLIPDSTCYLLHVCTMVCVKRHGPFVLSVCCSCINRIMQTVVGLGRHVRLLIGIMPHCNVV